jgi:hypothetical protein
MLSYVFLNWGEGITWELFLFTFPFPLEREEPFRTGAIITPRHKLTSGRACLIPA